MKVILYFVDLTYPDMTKVIQLVMPICQKQRIISYSKSVENHATKDFGKKLSLAEGFLCLYTHY